MSKSLSKYIGSFDYFDKSLIALSVTTGSLSIPSFATVVGAPVGMMSASCSRTYYFYIYMINLKDFELDLLKIDKKSYKNIGIYNIGHLTIKKIDNYGGIYSINPLYLQINYASGYIEEKNEIKYSIFDDSKKTSASKECNICGFKYEPYLCNGFHD